MFGEIPQMPLLWVLPQPENVNFFVGSEDRETGSHKDGRSVKGSLIRTVQTAREAREKASNFATQRKVKSCDFEKIPERPVGLVEMMYHVMKNEGSPEVLLAQIRKNSKKKCKNNGKKNADFKHKKIKKISLSTIIKMDRNPYLLLNNFLNMLKAINDLFLESQWESNFQTRVGLNEKTTTWDKMISQGDLVLAEEILLGASHQRKPSLKKFIKLIAKIKKDEKLKKLFVAAVGGPHFKRVFDTVLEGIQKRRENFKPLKVPFDISEIKEMPKHSDRLCSVLEIGNMHVAVRLYKRQKKKDPSKFNYQGRFTYLERTSEQTTESFLYRLLVTVNDYGYLQSSKAMLNSIYSLISETAQDDISESLRNEAFVASHNEASVSTHNEVSTYSNLGEDFGSELELSYRSASDSRLDNGVEKEPPKVSSKGKEKEKEVREEKEKEKEVDCEKYEIKEVIGKKEEERGPDLYIFYSSLLKKISQPTIEMFDNGVKERFFLLFQQKTFTTKGETAWLKVKINKKTYCEISLKDAYKAKVYLRRLHTFILQIQKMNTLQKVRIGHMWVQLAFVIDPSVKDQYKAKITDFSMRKISPEEKVKSKLVNKAQKFIRKSIKILRGTT